MYRTDWIHNAPVSYTHLDVYKRQLRTHEVTPFANKKNSMKTMLDVSGDLALWYTGEEIVVFAFGSNTKAVSYTHLDVYKRQGGCSPPSPTKCWARFPT